MRPAQTMHEEAARDLADLLRDVFEVSVDATINEATVALEESNSWQQVIVRPTDDVLYLEFEMQYEEEAHWLTTRVIRTHVQYLEATCYFVAAGLRA